MAAFLHWLDVELWTPMWPNVFSPNIWTLVALAVHLMVTLVQRERHHQDMKRHVTETAAGGVVNTQHEGEDR